MTHWQWEDSKYFLTSLEKAFQVARKPSRKTIPKLPLVVEILLANVVSTGQ